MVSTEPARVDDDASRPVASSPIDAGAPRLALVAHDVEPDVDAEPDLETLARGLALCVAEIMAGARELDTIARWITEDVYRHLVQRVHVAARARSVARRPSTRPALRVGSVVVDRPTPDVAETAVVLHGRARSRAVAIRLERGERGWRATTIAVL
jgi:hypothetical protein